MQIGRWRGAAQPIRMLAGGFEMQNCFLRGVDLSGVQHLAHFLEFSNLLSCVRYPGNRMHFELFILHCALQVMPLIPLGNSVWVLCFFDGFFFFFCMLAWEFRK